MASTGVDKYVRFLLFFTGRDCASEFECLFSCKRRTFCKRKRCNRIFAFRRTLCSLRSLTHSILTRYLLHLMAFWPFTIQPFRRKRRSCLRIDSWLERQLRTIQNIFVLLLAVLRLSRALLYQSFVDGKFSHELLKFREVVFPKVLIAEFIVGDQLSCLCQCTAVQG